MYTVEEDEDENEHVRVGPLNIIDRAFELKRDTDSQEAVRDVICPRRFSGANCTQRTFMTDVGILFGTNTFKEYGTVRIPLERLVQMIYILGSRLGKASECRKSTDSPACSKY